jgi:hypothetical protein
MRPVYVYRLVVDLPDGVDWANPPEAWLEEHGVYGGHYDEDPPRFSWPARRNYLSPKGAREAADRLISYGAHVTIRRSLPVRVPDEPCATTDTASYCDQCARGDHPGRHEREAFGVEATFCLCDCSIIALEAP